MKMSSQRGVSGGGAFALASNSQTNGFGVNLGVGGVNSMGNRGRVLGPLGPHMSSLEGYRPNPSGLMVSTIHTNTRTCKHTYMQTHIHTLCVL